MKGCPYCRGELPLLAAHDCQVWLERLGTRLCLRGRGGGFVEWGTAIEYCPACGAPSKEEAAE